MYRIGDTAACIENIKRRLGVWPVDRLFDERLAERIRGIQMVAGLPVTGWLDDRTAKVAKVDSLVEPQEWT